MRFHVFDLVDLFRKVFVLIISVAFTVKSLSCILNLFKITRCSGISLFCSCRNKEMGVCLFNYFSQIAYSLLMNLCADLCLFWRHKNEEIRKTKKLFGPLYLFDIFYINKLQNYQRITLPTFRRETEAVGGLHCHPKSRLWMQPWSSTTFFSVLFLIKLLKIDCCQFSISRN